MKRKLVWGLTVLLILAAAVFYYLSSKRFRAPEFIGMEQLEYLGRQEQMLEVKATAVFRNPNALSARLVNTEIKVYSNEVSVAVISQTGSAELRAESEFRVPLHFKIDLLSLGLSQSLSGILSQALSEDRSLPLRFEGYCRVKTGEKVYKIPLDYSQTLHFR